MDFGDGAVGAKVADAEGEGRIELRGIEKFEKSALGIDAGDDSFDSDFFAIGENKAANGAVFHADVLNLGVGADFDACLAGGIGKSVGKRAEPTARESGRAGGMGVRGGAKKQHGRGTGGPGTERGAKDAAGRDHSAEQIRFKKFRNEIGDSHGAPAEQIKNTVLAEAANAATGLEKVPEILGRG